MGHYTQVQPVPNSAALESLRLLRETDCRETASKGLDELSAWSFHDSIRRLSGTGRTKSAVLWPTVPMLSTSTSTSASTARRKCCTHAYLFRHR